MYERNSNRNEIRAIPLNGTTVFCRTHPPFPSLHAAAEFARNLPNVKEWDVKELRVTPAEAGKMKRIQEFFADYEGEDGL